jgi:hypothetical protein
MVGLTRQIDNIRAGRQDAYGHEGDPWGSHVRGAMAEKTIAKYLRRYWSGNLGDLHAADVSQRLQVRSSLHANARLIVHPSPGDQSDHAYVLVIGDWPRYRICGWLWGYEAQQDRWWDDPKGNRPAFFVPQLELHSIDSLPLEVL